MEEIEASRSTHVKDIKDLDTIVCPARPDGFKMAFKGQKAWWAVRISSSMLSQLKYIAMYEGSPVSAIRWAGKIQAIKPYEDTGKYKIHLSEIFKVGPVKMKKANNAPQGTRYTNFHLLEHSRTLEEIF
ncbi:hypothetical protein GF389_03115 [Candidatus Dojkabacteria bacterium]|nr:hypothetical protein [Candidatus Dojkabacteria bacterium]